jgi:3-hydroxyisobutyrate dehydrogenase-like beta-hydroxyacid dehydrogenase
MQVRTVAILSPGDMGHATGNVLREGGLRVVTCLRGRSERTRGLAEQAGIEDLTDLDSLVRESEIVLSIVAPAHARQVAESIAAAVQRTHSSPLFVDCNAVSPMTVKGIARVIAATGARFADVGIIGNPPKPGPQATRYYVSGEHAEEVAGLSSHGLDVRVVGSEVGQASALKMCYAALTKGLTALATELHVAAEASGMSEPLRAELELSQRELLQWIRRMVPTMPAKAWRWIGEMEEIADTFDSLGLTPKMLQGAADMYRLAEQAPEPGASLEDVVVALAGLTRPRAPAASAPSAAGSGRARSKAD